VHVSQAANITLAAAKPSLWTVVSPSFHRPNDPLDAYRRGQCALNQQDRALAVFYLRQSIAAGYPGKEAYSALATAYRQAGNVPAAEEAERQAQMTPVNRSNE
jgi:Flp pilus assembly protein TadD